MLCEAELPGLQNGRMKMAKATTGDTTGADKPVKANKPGKAAPAAAPGLFQRIGTYFRDVRAEMNRVVWPTRPEVLNSSVVVVTTLLFFVAFITFVDYLVVIPLLKLVTNLKLG
jgi:preprotein translocase subunit SecE